MKSHSKPVYLSKSVKVDSGVDIGQLSPLPAFGIKKNRVGLKCCTMSHEIIIFKKSKKLSIKPFMPTFAILVNVNIDLTIHVLLEQTEIA